MSSNSVIGDHYSFISFVFSIPLIPRWSASWIAGAHCFTQLNTVSLNDLSSFRQIPTFGRDTIRKFTTNMSELNKLAARDYEDLLQVSGLPPIWIAMSQSHFS